jgi:predicted metal-dependent peptidase
MLPLNEQVKQRFEQVKLRLLRHHPLYYYFLIRMKVMYNDKEKLMAKRFPCWASEEGIHLGHLFLALPFKEAAHAIIHEILHRVLKHPQRLKELMIKEGSEFNLKAAWWACDAKVEQIIKDDRLGYRNTPVLYHLNLSETHIRQMSMEEIYNHLKNRTPTKQVEDVIGDVMIGKTRGKKKNVIQEGETDIESAVRSKRDVR